MKNKKSKKPLIVVATVLMIGLVAGMGAMTYSKYITSGSTGNQTATAAKWGFVVTVDADDLFVKDYTLAADDATLAAKATVTGVAVHASGDANLVAPGTTGSMTITINGSAEVLARLSIKTTGGDPIEISLGDYRPVVWTLKESSTGNISSGKLSAVLESLTATSTTFDAGTPCNITYTLTWEWPLETGDDDDTKAANNAKDTLIGYKAAGKKYADIKDTYVGSKLLSEVVTSAETYDAIVAQMSFDLEISVEQIQSKPTV